MVVPKTCLSHIPYPALSYLLTPLSADRVTSSLSHPSHLKPRRYASTPITMMPLWSAPLQLPQGTFNLSLLRSFKALHPQRLLHLSSSLGASVITPLDMMSLQGIASPTRRSARCSFKYVVVNGLCIFSHILELITSQLTLYNTT